MFSVQIVTATRVLSLGAEVHMECIDLCFRSNTALPPATMLRLLVYARVRGQVLSMVLLTNSVILAQ